MTQTNNSKLGHDEPVLEDTKAIHRSVTLDTSLPYESMFKVFGYIILPISVACGPPHHLLAVPDLKCDATNCISRLCRGRCG